MSSAPNFRGRVQGMRDWLFAFFAACTAWLIVQNVLLLTIAWITTRGRP